MRILSIAATIIGCFTIAACTPSTETTAKQFALCEMDAIKNMGYQQGDWSSPAGRYLYACMRSAGYDLKSHRTPKEGYCTLGDMQRIVMPECYQPMRIGWFPWGTTRESNKQTASADEQHTASNKKGWHICEVAHPLLIIPNEDDSLGFLKLAEQHGLLPHPRIDVSAPDHKVFVFSEGTKADAIKCYMRDLYPPKAAGGG
jgi:hypothetical protein